MAQNQEGEAGGFGQRVAPWRPRAASGMPLSVLPPPPPTILAQPRRTLIGIAAGSPGGFLSLPPPPARANSSVDADWEDENEDDVTDVHAEWATLVFKRDGVRDDETTHELPRPTLRRVPAPPSAAMRSSPPPLPPRRAAAAPGGGPGPVSLPPSGFDVLSASLAAASLPPPAFTAALVRANEARTPLQRPGVPSLRVAAALSAAAVVALIAFALKPRQGTIVVSAKDSRGGPVSRLDVFVDGERAPCNAAPCSVPCAKGVHEVKITAEGFDVPATQAVAVASGDSTPAQFIVGSSSESGFKVSGSQDGVKLAVDGKEIGPLPQVLRDLVPGDHTIGLAGSERYQPILRHVTVERDKLEDLGTITLKVVKGNVTVRPGTPGARVFLVSGSDRRELLALPTALDIDTSKTWHLEATEGGYKDYRQPIDFSDGKAEKTYAVTLEPESTATQVWAAPTRGPGPSPVLPAHPAPAAPAAKSSPAKGGGGGAHDGYLNINSLPASTCFLDGKSLGSTPRLRVSVSAGSHTVKFRSPDSGLTKTVVVNIGAGETRLAVARLN